MLEPSPHRSLFPLLSVLIVIALAASACDTPGRVRSQNTAALNTGLDTLVESPAQRPSLPDINLNTIREQRPSDLLALIEQAQINSQMDLDARAEAPEQQVQLPPAPINQSKPPEVNRGPSVSLDDLIPEPDAIDSVAASPEIASEEIIPLAPEPTPEERFEQSATELQMALEDRVRASTTPASDLFRRIAFGLVHQPSQVDAAAIGGDGVLTPRETSQLEAWATFIASASQTLDSASGIDSITDAALELANALDSWQPLSITKTVLCTSVDGYGIYKKQQQYGDAYKFLAGRPIKFLIYIELDHFTHTSKSREGAWGYEVSLSQDLRLYHMALGGDALVWRLPDEPLVDFSQNQRRDFFVVQLVELPATLGVGGYRLKIAINDNASGAIAEEVIPIEIVADIAAFQED